jgi:hypothetical protein
MLGRYREILRFPGALRFSLAGLLARLQVAMAGLGITLLVLSERGSFLLAAQLTAAYAVAAAVVAPWIARLVDQHGQYRVVPAQLSVHAPAVLALILLATIDGWHAVMLLLALVAGASQVSVGSLVRARWSKIYAGTPHLRTAFAWEGIADEIAFVLAPLLAVALVLSVTPSAALLFATLAVTVGCALLVLHRASEPLPTGIPSPRPSGDTPLMVPGVGAIAAVFLLLGAVVGSFEITTIGFALGHGVDGYVGVLLALYATGSLVAGVVLARKAAIAHSRLLLVTVGGLAVVTIPLALVESGLLLGPLALLAGAAVAPALASGMALMERALPTRLTEGRSVLNRALAVGVAVGLLLSGWLLEEATPSTAYLVTTGSAFAALAIVLAVRGSLVSVDAELASPHEPQLQPST